ncbi:syntaxin-binding protein 6 isoform X4 [Bubalus bubalis]|uniref:syntaxin-binding protein 6 isoform X4 n=1 Tax=Bubalus bubalis TaxID=89462 RepID=UPI001D10EB6A|nr:syntaxin-binding protein 6 isoform X4 [Bubalus bubalis]
MMPVLLFHWPCKRVTQISLDKMRHLQKKFLMETCTENSLRALVTWLTMSAKSAISKEIFAPLDERMLGAVQVKRRTKKKIPFLATGGQGEYLTYICLSAYLGDSAVEAGPWNDSCSFLLSERTPYAFWESKPFNPCGLVDENQLSMLNRQNLSKLRQCLQIIFNHISYCIKSYILFLKRRLSKLSKLANVRMSAWVFYILNVFY